MAHILVVDDRPLNRQLLATLLGYFGHSVAQAADGVAALEQVASRLPDLMITDLLMPNMDGEELCTRLRADPATSTLEIIIHTASYRTRQARLIADRVGVRWVLPKPCEPAEIMAMVDQALGLHDVQELVSLAIHETPVRQSPQQYLPSLQEGSHRLARLLADASEIAQAQARALAAADLGQSAESLAHRFGNLVNLSLQMSSERDPAKLVDRFCAAAQDILGARYVGVVILTPQGEVRKFASAGLDRADHEAVLGSIHDCAVARRVLGSPGQTRMVVAAKAGDFTGLPQGHPAVRSMLACPVAARDVVSGWMYAADRLEGDGFENADERLISALGAVLATMWSSIMVLDDLDRRVAERTRELEAANAELQAFSALVSHDLQSPLGNISGFVEALRMNAHAVLPVESKRYLGRIESNVAIMTRLIADLLHFARTSREVLSPRTVDLAPLMQSCLNEFSEEIAQRGVVVTLGSLGRCSADSPLLKQVMLNLIGNALKYTRNQPKPVIAIDCKRVGAELLITVRDNGAGFDMEFANALFKPFSRLHSNSEFEGSGIGLALVRQIVNRHGGRVWAEGEPDKGACIFFTLPVQAAARTIEP